MNIWLWIIGFVLGGILEGAQLACYNAVFRVITHRLLARQGYSLRSLGLSFVIYAAVGIPICGISMSIGQWIDAHFEGAGQYGAWTVLILALYFWWKNRKDDDDDDREDRKEKLPEWEAAPRTRLRWTSAPIPAMGYRYE